MFDEMKPTHHETYTDPDVPPPHADPDRFFFCETHEHWEELPTLVPAAGVADALAETAETLRRVTTDDALEVFLVTAMLADSFEKLARHYWHSLDDNDRELAFTRQVVMSGEVGAFETPSGKLVMIGVTPEEEAQLREQYESLKAQMAYTEAELDRAVSLQGIDQFPEGL